MSGLQKQIEALKVKLSRKGKQLPSVCFVHYPVLGIMRRDGTPVFAIPDLPVTVPGSRPPTESLASIDQTRLLQHVPRAKRAQSIIYSDGNTAWQSAIRSVAVCHQNKQWTRIVRAKHGGHRKRVLAGTQALDRAWLALKFFIGPNDSRKYGHDKDARESNLVRLLLQQHMWRQSHGTLSPREFLNKLSKAFRRLKA